MGPKFRSSSRSVEFVELRGGNSEIDCVRFFARLYFRGGRGETGLVGEAR